MVKKFVKKICEEWVEGEQDCEECNHEGYCEDWVRDNFHSLID